MRNLLQKVFIKIFLKNSAKEYFIDDSILRLCSPLHRPYVVHRRRGHALDKSARPVRFDDYNAYIPLDEYTFMPRSEEEDDTPEPRQQLLNFLDVVFELASEVYQDRIWIQGEGPFVSSWEECLCRLEDSNFEELIEAQDLWNKDGLSIEDRFEIIAFKIALDKYSDNQGCPLAFDKSGRQDLQWCEIHERAKALREHFWPIYKKICEELAKDSDPKKRESVLLAMWTPVSVVEGLAQDPLEDIAIRARESLEAATIKADWMKQEAKYSYLAAFS